MNTVDPDDDPRSNGHCLEHGDYNGREPRCPTCTSEGDLLLGGSKMQDVGKHESYYPNGFVKKVSLEGIERVEIERINNGEILISTPNSGFRPFKIRWDGFGIEIEKTLG